MTVHCRHGVPWYACARMCPDPSVPVVQPGRPGSRAGWVMVGAVALVVVLVVAWRVVS